MNLAYKISRTNCSRDVTVGRRTLTWSLAALLDQSIEKLAGDHCLAPSRVALPGHITAVSNKFPALTTAEWARAHLLAEARDMTLASGGKRAAASVTPQLWRVRPEHEG